MREITKDESDVLNSALLKSVKKVDATTRSSKHNIGGYMNFEEWAHRSGLRGENSELALCYLAWAAGTKVEREACAKVCESKKIGYKHQGDVYAAAIRARSNE